MPFWDSDLFRIGAGIATGGASELVRAGVKVAGRIADPPKVSTEQTDEDRKRSLDLYNQLLAERANTPAFQPERVGNANVQAQDVSAVTTGPIERVRSADVAAPQDVTINPQTRGVTARNVAAPVIGPAAQAGVAQTNAAQIRDAQGQQIRGRQLGALDLVQGAATGAAPSVAQAKYAENLADLQAQQLGVAAQARGNQGVFARREAMRNLGDMGQKASLDAALLQAQEMATARGQLTGALSDVRGTDTNTAISQAGLEQGANLANLGEVGTTNRFNAGQGNDMTRFGAQLTSDVAAANANRGLTADTTTALAQNQRDVDIASVQAGNVGRTVGVQTGNADRSVGVQTRNANAADTNAVGNANRITDTAVGNANRNLQGQTTTAGLAQNADVSNQGAGLTANSQRIAEQGNKTNAVLQANNQVAGGTAQAANIQAGNNQVQAQTDNALIGAGAGGAASLAKVSDENAKKDVSRDSDRDIDAFLGALEEHGYRYRDPAEGAGERHGPMAQELERSAIGRSLVHTGPDGVKRVDTEGLTLALAGAVARMRRQMAGRKAA